MKRDKPRTWFVSRHPGALEWAVRRGLRADACVAHLEAEKVSPGDTVIGTLPVHLAAEVCARGGRYLNLSLDLPEQWRGQELSADEMEACGAQIVQYAVEEKAWTSMSASFPTKRSPT